MARTQIWVGLVSVVSLIAMVPASFGSPLPDQYDFRKYLAIYERAQQDSQSKRGAADDALSRLRNSEAQRDQARIELSQLEQAIATTESQILGARGEISQLQSQNDAIRGELGRNQSDWNAARNTHATELARLSEARREQDAAERVYQQADADLNRKESALRALQQRIEAARTSRDQAYAELASAQNQIKAAQQELPQLASQINAQQDQVNQLNSQLATLRSQLTHSQSELQQAQDQLARAQAALKPQQDRARQAQVAADAARQKLQAAQAAATNAQRELDTAQRELVAAQGQMTALDKRLGELRSDLSTIQAQISSAESEGKRAQEALERLDAEVASAKTEVERARAEAGRVSLELRRTQAEFDRLKATSPNDPKLRALAQEIRELTAKQTKLTEEARTADARLQALQGRRNDLVAKVRASQAEVARLKARAQDLPNAIAQTERELTAARSRASAAQQKVTQEQSQLASAQNAANAASGDVTRAQAVLDDAKRDLASAEAAVAPLVQRRDAAQNRVSALSNDINQKQSALTQAQSELTRLVSRRQELEQRIATLQGNLNKLTAHAQATDRMLRDLQNDLPALDRDVDQARAVRDAQARRLQTANARVAELERRINELAVVIARLEDLIRSQNDAITGNAARIQQLSSYVDQTTRALAQMRQDRDSRRTEIVQLERDIHVLQGRYAVLNADANQAEAVALTAYNDYKSRQDAYDDQILQAQQLGAPQATAIATADGAANGEAQGVAVGTDQGTSTGKSQGLAYGYEQGRLRGDADGYAAGKAQGSASEADYESGRQQGIKLGSDAARAEATRTEYPRGGRDKRAELMSVLPIKEVVIGGTPAVRTLFASSASELQDSLEALMPEETEQGPNCPQQIDEFRQACLDAYQAEYDRAYRESYDAAYQRAFAPAFAAAKQAAFDAHKNVRYDEGYAAGNSAGTARGLADGQAEARNRGIADGRTQGYAQTIDGAKASEYARGAQEMIAYFGAHAVLRAQGAAVDRVGADGTVGGNPGVGDLLKLKLDIINFGGAASRAGAFSVVMEPLTRGLAVDTRLAQGMSIPAATVAHVQGLLTAKVLPAAIAGTEEQLRVRVTYEDGTTSESTIRVRIVSRVQAEIRELRYVQRPAVGRLQLMKVSVANVGKINPTETMTVQLSSTAPASELAIGESSIVIRSFQVGSLWLIGDLTYTIKSQAALTRGIPLRVSILHGASVVTAQDIVIRN